MKQNPEDTTAIHSLKSANTPRGFTCLQTDDTLNAANRTFADMEQKKSSRFICKDAKFLSDENPIRFNGATIYSKSGTIYLTQPENISKLSTIETDSISKDEFISQRARGSYIAAVCRPDLTFAFSKAAQVIIPTLDDCKELNKYIKVCMDSPSRGLKFVKLDSASVSVSVFVDASFASNKDMTSQLGFIITLMDNNQTANILHYGSIKAKRVARSVLAAELFAMVHGFDISSTLRLTLNELYGKIVPLKIFTDSKSLYDSMVRINSTTEKRLLIDLIMLRQSYERREITDVYWIPTGQNPADGLTKGKRCSALEKLMDENKLDLTPNAWVERGQPSWAR